MNLLMTTTRIVLHEDFAGMGTCGASLCQQLQAMRNKVVAMKPDLRSSVLEYGLIARLYFRANANSNNLNVFRKHVFVAPSPSKPFVQKTSSLLAFLPPFFSILFNTVFLHKWFRGVGARVEGGGLGSSLIFRGLPDLKVELTTAYDINPNCRFALATRPKAGTPPLTGMLLFPTTL